MGSIAVIIAGGDAPPPDALDDLAGAEHVIAANGGLAVARALGLVPTLVVGDLDSADPADIAWAESAGALVDRHPHHKDFTDLELALARADDGPASRIVVIGAGGGRVDHELGNWAAVSAPRTTPVEVRNAGGTTWVLRGELELDTEPGSVLSLLAWGDDAVVTTIGLRWELHEAVLSPFEARGVSNVADAEIVEIRVSSGVLLVMRPR